MFEGFLNESIIKRAIDDDKVIINTIDFRTFSTNKHQKVDDYPFGGGAGMVLKAQPIYDALVSIDGYEDAMKIIVTPQGKPFEQDDAYNLANLKHLIILCGHYEGFDERVREYFDLELSIGDFVLTGGELAAMVITDAVTRLLDGVLGKEDSHINDSFNNGLLEHPHYTRPREFKGKKVPEVLLNGNHKEIDKWRFEASLKRTKERRPDLFEKHQKKND
jgi:tRNA (guanine37-N1)-methyltransferase